ncbi:hypothetical protein SCA03_63760 [Streptomyces cacaoi]|uniref:Uncharacterized protein n=1 Tax=Streptomyces cacaoi TaxID=1898 RepID=A0A4Y3R7W9_STRCI|nr:hypothetical protein SCA03_63760 [Streptomyces cacaoi]
MDGAHPAAATPAIPSATTEAATRTDILMPRTPKAGRCTLCNESFVLHNFQLPQEATSSAPTRQ